MQSLRGICGEVSLDLAPLNVIVGRNGVGKSTIVDAALIGSANNPADALGRIVRRRVAVRHGARWLVTRSSVPGSPVASVRAESSQGVVRETRISLMENPTATLVEDLVRRYRDIGDDDVQAVRVQVDDGRVDADHRATFEVAFEPGNGYSIKASDVPAPLRVGAYVRLVDAKLIQEPLTDAFSRTVQTGRIANVLDILQSTEPGISSLQILTDDDQPYLAATVRGVTMPLSLVGDGVRVLARLAFEIEDIRDGGLLLVEEPEIHQHPVAVGAIAKSLVDASRRGVQVVVTTHSLDMVEDIRGQFDVGRDVPEIAFFYLSKAADSSLTCVRSAGRDIYKDGEWTRFQQQFRSS